MSTVLNGQPLPHRPISFLIADRWSLIAFQTVGCNLSAVG